METNELEDGKIYSFCDLRIETADIDMASPALKVYPQTGAGMIIRVNDENQVLIQSEKDE